MSPTKIKFGIDTVKVQYTSYLIFLMQLGFAFLAAGTVRSKNLNAILLKSIIGFCFAIIFWWIFGFNFAFGNSAGGFIGFEKELFAYSNFSENDYENNYYNFMFQQLQFQIASITIVVGSIAERMPVKTYIYLSMFISLYIYPIQCHWCWGNGGFLKNMGFKDFAGSGVVHLHGGLIGLIGTYMLGPRKHRFDKSKILNERDKFKMSSVPFIALGTMFLWFCWYGFNCGSLLEIENIEQSYLFGQISLNTTLASASGGLTTFLYQLLVFKEESINKLNVYCCQGILSGLIAVTASCNDIENWAAIIIGVLGGLMYTQCSKLLIRLQIDDPLDASALHGGAGFIGIVSVGIFSKTSGLITGQGQIGVQLIGAVLLIAWAITNSLIVYILFQNNGILHISVIEDEFGMDYYMEKQQQQSQKNYYIQQLIKNANLPTKRKSINLSQANLENPDAQNRKIASLPQDYEIDIKNNKNQTQQQ